MVVETEPVFDRQILEEIEAALTFTTTPHYLNRFDVLILIALKRFGLHYNCRRKIIDHYRTICDRREFEREIQRFIFAKSTSDKALRLPFQQGMNNLVPIRRKYGPVFERHYVKYMSNLAQKLNKSDIKSAISQHHGSSLGLLYLILNENINKISVGSFFDPGGRCTLSDNILSCRVTNAGDIVINITIVDPLKLIETVTLQIGYYVIFEVEFSTFLENSKVYFNLDLTLSLICNFTDIFIKIKCKSTANLTMNHLIENIIISILYHQLEINHRRLLVNNKLYSDVHLADRRHTYMYINKCCYTL